MTMITPSYLGETIEYSSLHACRSTLEDPTISIHLALEALLEHGRIAGGGVDTLFPQRIESLCVHGAPAQLREFTARNLTQKLIQCNSFCVTIMS